VLIAVKLKEVPIAAIKRPSVAAAAQSRVHLDAVPFAIGGDDVVLCSHCGQEKGSDVCCIVTAEKCDKCGKAKGSLGCCLLVEETGKDKHDHLDQVPN